MQAGKARMIYTALTYVVLIGVLAFGLGACGIFDEDDVVPSAPSVTPVGSTGGAGASAAQQAIGVV